MRTPMLRLAAAALLVTAIACGDNTGPSADERGLHAVLGANLTDTVLARFSQALVVRVGDAKGNPLSGVTVRFESLAQDSPPNIYGYTNPTTYLSRLDRQQYDTFQADTTRADGRVSMLVMLGTIAGPAGVVVSAPALGLVDTVRYTVTPGAAARIVMSKGDTAVTPGAQYLADARVADRFGNARTETPTYAYSGAIASVDGTGRVTAGNAVGTGVVRASFGTLKDSSVVQVVPAGRMVVMDSRTGPVMVAFVNVDGSGYTALAGSVSGGFPALRPDGAQVVFHEPASPGASPTLVLVDVATKTRQALIDPSVMVTAMYPRYSPDGAWIYFSGQQTYSTPLGIWRVRPNGTGLTPVAMPDAGTYGGFSYPDVSPNGLEVAYTDRGSNAVIIKTLSSGATRTTSLRGSFPRWSPDGNALAAVGGAVSVLSLADGATQTFGSGTYDGNGGLTWCPNSACLIARSYYGLAMSVRATGQQVELRVNRNTYQASF